MQLGLAGDWVSAVMFTGALKRFDSPSPAAVNASSVSYGLR
jgi:hypothetical protein